MLNTRSFHRQAKWLALLAFAPRYVALGALSSLLTGCVVPQHTYDKAVADARQEAEAQRRTTLVLYEVGRQLEAARQQLAARETELYKRKEALERRDLDLEQSGLDLSHLEKERDDATLLVDQLRGELGRVGDHLRVFSEQKRELALRLERAQQKASELAELERGVLRRALLVRDMTFALHEPLAQGELQLAPTTTGCVVSIPTETAFAETGALHPEAMTLLERIAQAATDPELRVELSEHASSDGKPDQSLVARLQTLADGLAQAGIALDRVAFSLAEPRTTPGPAGDGVPASTAGGGRVDIAFIAVVPASGEAPTD